MLNILLFLNLELGGVSLLILLNMKNMWMEEEFFFSDKMVDMNFWMIMLVFFLYLSMLMVDISFKLSLNLLFIVLLMLMKSSSFLVFFFYYEMIFIVIMFVILLLGYSYERLMASYLMMFYSFIFSSPVLMLFLIFNQVFLMKNWISYSSLFMMFMVGSFSVKFPIFGLHYWLPVAHVEASTIGSMLLAGILLKIGCIGLFYIVYYLKFMMKLHWLSLSVVVVMLMILLLSDLKMMIAYSSIAHMSMVFYVFMIGSYVGKQGGLIMMFYHGYISPLMFWLVGLLSWFKTRSLMVIKYISFSYIFLLIIFILCILNMGFPPFMGFMSEILMLKSMIQMKLILGVFIISILLSAYYNIYLFWCFNSFMGQVFKLNLLSMDLFLIMILVIFLNF